MAKKMTLAKAKQLAKTLYGISIRKTPAGDYRVNFIGAPEAYAVYEAYVGDAVETARAMWRYRTKQDHHI